MIEVFLDSLKDSLIVFVLAFFIYIIISFIETKIAYILGKKNRFSPIMASALGLIPQCGIGVIGSDLYQKEHLTIGTLVALFISCSDEALPILLSQINKQNVVQIILLFVIKFTVGFISGYLIDLIFTKKDHHVHEHLEHCEHHTEQDVHTGCCGHHIEDDKKDTSVYRHLVHPLLHSLKIFIYVFIITFLFGNLIYLIGGTETLMKILETNKYFAVLISSIIGIIPNCAVSVIITELYLLGGLSFGACIAGLCMNAGLGLLFLFKRKGKLKENLTILGLMLLISNIVGYLICIITSF